MVSFLFWNLGGDGSPERIGSLTRHLSRLAENRQVDVLVLVESPLSIGELILSLSSSGRDHFWGFESHRKRFQFLTRLSKSTLSSRLDSLDGRLCVIRLCLQRGDLLIAAFHGQSKRDFDDISQTLQMVDVADQIRRLEDDDGHRQTIVIGDFNQDPFEAGVLSSRAFHAVPTRRIAAQESRIVSGNQSLFFYNPMWSCLGDRTEGPPGSYYYRKANQVCQFWHSFDQLLIRPVIMNSLATLKILDSDGIASLVTKTGIPDKKNASDHLPVFFQLDLNILELQ